MAHFLAETDSLLDRALEELRQRLGLEEHQQTDLLQKLAGLAAWVIQQAEAGRRIEAREILAQLEADPSQQLMTRIQLDDEQVHRLAEVLARLARRPRPCEGCSPRSPTSTTGRPSLHRAQLGDHHRVAGTAAQFPIAFRLFVTDAIDEAAARFYEHHGFARLASTAPCRLVLDLGPLILE